MMRTALVFVLAVSSPLSAAAPEPRDLARAIDRRLAERWKSDNVQPAPRADDAEFLRRAYLDLTGRIPVSHDVYKFLDDPRPDKRARLIDELLESPRHAQHFANVWRALLIPETAASRPARLFQTGFEAWLTQKFRANVPFDRFVHDLLTVRVVGQAAMKNEDEPNPLAFYALKEASPANLAAATTRLFLGIRIECAQCHDHPFARWSREQFWNQAAFFAGITRDRDRIFSSLRESFDRREIALGDTKKMVPAVFLDGKAPAWREKTSPRVALADWITAPANPYFARASANRVWGQLMGRGLVEPVDDVHDENPPSHPELLDDLGRAFVSAQFDLRFLIRAICATDAYQRTSARTHPTQDDPRRFARMAVKGLSGEQFFDSLALAVGFKEVSKERPIGQLQAEVRAGFLERFAARGTLSDPETSIPQALLLMNGPFVDESTQFAKGPNFTAVCEMPAAGTADRVQALYVLALSRKPTAAEIERLMPYVTRDGPEGEARRLSDVFWALLNSAEFRLNH